jgi:predicted O-methyltransferase YrrM
MKTDIFYNLDRYNTTFKIEDKLISYWNDAFEKGLKLQESIRILRFNIKKDKIKEKIMGSDDTKIKDYLLKFFKVNMDDIGYFQMDPKQSGVYDLQLQDDLFYCSKKYKTIYKYWHPYQEIKDLDIYQRIAYQEKKHIQAFLSLFNCLNENGIYVCHNFGFDQRMVKMTYIALLLFNRIVIYDQYIGFIEFNPKISIDECRNLFNNLDMVSFSEVRNLDDFGKYYHNKMDFNFQMYKSLEENNYSKYYQYVQYLFLNSTININDYSSIEELLYENLKITTVSGDEIKTSIKPKEGKFLFKLIKDNKIKACLEVGFDYGITAMYITTALKQLGNGKLTSIDPFQKTKSNYNGSKLIMTLKNEAFHELIEDYSYYVLPPMIKKGIRFNLVFISNNTFDYALNDVIFSDMVLDIDGYLIIDDVLHRGMNKLTKFIDSNYKHYKKIQSPQTIAVYKKTSDDERSNDFYENF